MWYGLDDLRSSLLSCQPSFNLNQNVPVFLVKWKMLPFIFVALLTCKILIRRRSKIKTTNNSWFGHFAGNVNRQDKYFSWILKTGCDFWFDTSKVISDLIWSAAKLQQLKTWKICFVVYSEYFFRSFTSDILELPVLKLLSVETNKM